MLEPLQPGAPTLFVILGIGDLMGRKLMTALYSEWHRMPESERNLRFKVLLSDMFEAPDVRQLLATKARQHSHVEWLLKASDWQQYAGLFSYRQTGRTNEEAKALFDAIVEHKRAHPGAKIIFYMALPYKCYENVLERVRDALGQVEWTQDIYLVFEKPAADTVEGTKRLESLLCQARIPLSNAGIVEHFAAKHGFNQLWYWMYNTRYRNQTLRGEGVEKVRLIVTEKVGTENRKYDGIGVDSMLNHHAFFLAFILGNPREQGSANYGSTLGSRLSRLCYDPVTGAEEAASRIGYQEHMRALDPWGKYIWCAEDHCAPNHVPTGIYLKYKPNTDRWKGMTQFESLHLKNTCEKVTKVEFHLRGGDVWDFIIEGFEKGVRGWGWSEKTRQLRCDEMGDEPFFPPPVFHPIRPEMADGYPSVIGKLLALQFGHLMPLHFQEQSILALGPLLQRLDKTELNERVLIHRGNCFDLDDPPTLIKLY